MSMVNSPGVAVSLVGVPALTNVSTWAASTAYATGACVYPAVKNDRIYIVTDNGGTSHTSAPTWPTTVGATVTDNDITWTCYAADSVLTMVSVWAASTAYIRGAWCVPTVDNGYAYRCTTAGTTNAAEPEEWPTIVGGTVTDNSAVWTAYKLTEIDSKLLVAGSKGRLFFDQKNKYLYIDNGTSWAKVVV